jgi:hypothetical protein
VGGMPVRVPGSSFTSSFLSVPNERVPTHRQPSTKSIAVWMVAWCVGCIELCMIEERGASLQAVVNGGLSDWLGGRAVSGCVVSSRSIDVLSPVMTPESEGIHRTTLSQLPTSSSSSPLYPLYHYGDSHASATPTIQYLLL